jgi:uroporphyrinogen decarboxylase
MNTPNFRLLQAALKQPVDRTPVWLMRQAGRYMPEFRAIRQKVDFLTLCNTPELVVEVSMQPVDQLGVDGAIIFSDLLIPCQAMGSDLAYVKGEGPVIYNPVRTAEDVAQLGSPDPAEASPSLGEAIRMLKREVEPKIPVLGFTGAPWTTAAYMIEGGGSSHYIRTKQMMWREPELFQTLLNKISEVLVRYLCYQIEAGVRLVQLFDTWAGGLMEADYRRYCLPMTQWVIAQVKAKHPDIPVVLYVNNSHHLLEATAESGADMLSVDWRVDLAEADARKALEATAKDKSPIAAFLVKQGMVTAAQLAAAQSIEFGMPLVDVTSLDFNQMPVKLITHPQPGLFGAAAAFAQAHRD